MEPERDTFASRLAGIRSEMAAACQRAGRDATEVRLLPVTKKHGPDRIVEAMAHGLAVFGENRVQEARHKIPSCSAQAEWHLIGHLQRNKVRDAVTLFSMIHSVDSERLLVAIDEASGRAGRDIPVCLQVNVSGEASKFGMPPQDAGMLLERASRLTNVSVVGLMTIPPFLEDPEDVRPFFTELRTLRDTLRERTGFELPELSMGMSGDYTVAIEEGATWVRVGSALFGSRGA